MRITGKVTRVFPTVTTGEGADAKARQNFVVAYQETPGQFGYDTVLLTLFGAYSIKKHSLVEGDTVDVYIEHEVREYNGRSYNNIKIIQLRKVGNVEPQQAPQQPAESEEQPVNDLPWV